MRCVPLSAMKWMAGGALLALAAGCQSTDPDLKPRGTMNLSHRAVNEAMIESYNLDSVDNAVIRQHTIYPYHFIQNSDQLNTLGQREVYVLGHHYSRWPGPLNVHQGDESDALYQARVKTVTDHMVSCGVPANRIAVRDDMPGGDGLPSDQVVLVLTRMKTSRITGASAPPTSYTASEQLNQSSSTSTATQGAPLK